MRELAVMLAFACAPAFAQDAAPDASQDASVSPVEMQFGFGGDAPIGVEAETATYNGGLTILEDNVVVTQGETVVTSDRMEIYREEAETNSIQGSLRLGALQRIIAEGNFTFTEPENRVTGDKGTYYAEREIFIVEGNVVFSQPGGTAVRGNRLVYNLRTRAARFGTPCETGTAQAGQACERVRIRIGE